MKHSAIHSRFNPILGFLSVVFALLVGSGCVMSGAHDQVVAERDALDVAKRDRSEQIRLLQIANESLDEHVARLFDEREDLLEVREALATELATARDEKAVLASSLERRDEELAETAAALAVPNMVRTASWTFALSGSRKHPAVPDMSLGPTITPSIPGMVTISSISVVV